MSVIETVGDPNNPTSILAKTKSGDDIDLNNIPGRLKIKLILEDEMGVDQFVTPPNMPGKKLAALRAAHREKMEAILGRTLERKDEFKVGGKIGYQTEVFEVLGVREDAVKIEKSDGRKVWVKKGAVDLLKPVEDKKEDEE